MRNRTLYTTLATLAILPLAGCGLLGSVEPPAPEQPTVTSSTTTDPSTEAPEGTGKPTGALPEVSLDMSSVTALEAPEGADTGEFTRATENVEAYTLAMFNPTYLSGEWRDQPVDERWEVFSDIVGEELYEDMMELDPNDIEHANTIFSLAAVFTPTETVTSPAACIPEASPLKGCLTENIVTSEATAAVEDDSQLYVFTYKVSTARAVDIQGEAGQITLNYDVKLWVDPETGRAVSVNNSYSFSEATKVA